MIGFFQSPSPIPTARSMPRAGAASIPAVTVRLRGFGSIVISLASDATFGRTACYPGPRGPLAGTIPFPDPGEPAKTQAMIATVVWGTGNVGRAAIRAVDAHPALKLVAVLTHSVDKVGRDAGDLGELGHELGVTATDDIEAVLAASPRAVVYAASGDIRFDEALADLIRAIRAGAVVVTPSVYPLYDQRNAPKELREPVLAAIAAGGGSLFVSGVDPGWGNDVLPLLISGLGSEVDVIRCQVIFDYSTYDQPDSVRYLIGMGQPMDYQAPMLIATVPTMVWGGQVRMIARELGVELDEIRETMERRPLETTVTTRTMGEFEAGT